MKVYKKSDDTVLTANSYFISKRIIKKNPSLHHEAADNSYCIGGSPIGNCSTGPGTLGC